MTNTWALLISYMLFRAAGNRDVWCQWPALCKAAELQGMVCPSCALELPWGGERFWKSAMLSVLLSREAFKVI